MQQSYIDKRSSQSPPPHQNQIIGGAWLSIVGLIAWLGAMVMAVAGPLFGLTIPAPVIVATVVLSGVLSLLSLPRLLGTSQPDDAKPHR